MLETLKPLAEDRKCFRMINGVLVERTVKDLVPALETNSDGLKKVLDDLLKQYTILQNEMEKWKVCVHRGQSEAEADTRNRKRIISRWCSNESRRVKVYSCLKLAAKSDEDGVNGGIFHEKAAQRRVSITDLLRVTYKRDRQSMPAPSFTALVCRP